MADSRSKDRLFMECNLLSDASPLMNFLIYRLQKILELLEARLSDIQVDELRWQVSPRSNSIGMLLTHLAITEAYWMNVAPLGILRGGEENRLVVSIIGVGIDDDGMPLGTHSVSPPALNSKQWNEYRGTIHRARRKTIEQTSSWTDETLSTTFLHNEGVVSYGWALTHIYEHYCLHLGQILQIRSLWALGQ